jgi:DNA-binding MarR family transcriptional regulator
MPAEEFTPTERRILIALGFEEHQTDAQLARELGAGRSHLSRSMKQLIERGLVVHRPNPKHSSQRLIALSAQGAEAAVQLEERWAEALEAQLPDLSLEDLRAVHVTAGALKRDESGRPTFNVRVEPIDGKARAWALQQAAIRGTDTEIELANDIGRFLRWGLGGVGFAAYYFDRVVGTCMFVADNDDISMKVSGLYFDATAISVDAPKQMLNKCIESAKELTFKRIIATAREDERFVDTLYRKANFKRSREKLDVLRDNGMQVRRSYSLELPLYRDISA